MPENLLEIFVFYWIDPESSPDNMTPSLGDWQKCHINRILDIYSVNQVLFSFSSVVWSSTHVHLNIEYEIYPKLIVTQWHFIQPYSSKCPVMTLIMLLSICCKCCHWMTWRSLRGNRQLKRNYLFGIVSHFIVVYSLNISLEGFDDEYCMYMYMKW